MSGRAGPDRFAAFHRHGFVRVGASTPRVRTADVAFNRETLGEIGWFFSGPEDVARQVVAAEADAALRDRRASDVRDRAREHFRWDAVADAYEDLARRIAARASVHRGARRARRREEEWAP